MDIRVSQVKAYGAEGWVLPEYRPKEARTIQPVSKSEGTLFRTIIKDPASQAKVGAASLSPDKAKELAEDLQHFLENLNIGLNFEIHDKTGDVVIKLVNRDTQEVIRQIPPEDLLKLQEKLEELRGFLFSGKA